MTFSYQNAFLIQNFGFEKMINDSEKKIYKFHQERFFFEPDPKRMIFL